MDQLSPRHRRIYELGVRGAQVDPSDDNLGAALDAAGQRAQDHIGNAGPVDTSDLDDGRGGGGQGRSGEAPTPPASPGQPPPPPRAPDPSQVPDGTTYRDAAQLRAEMARYRQTYEPFEQVFGGMDDQARQTFLQAAPNLRGDLATIAATMGELHPDDRAYFLDVFQLMRTNPVEAAARLEAGVQALRGAGVAPQPGQGGVPGEDGQWQAPGASEPVTGADFDRMFEERWAQRQAQIEQEQQFREIDRDLQALGYNLDTQDPREAGEIHAVLEYARRTDGNLANAHRALKEAWGQSSIDNFVDEKRRDAGRRPAPTGEGAGASPSGERELQSMDDAEQAMLGRLEAAGVQGRRRQL